MPHSLYELAKEEKAAANEYAQLAYMAHDPKLKKILRGIANDERRHHRLLSNILLERMH